MFVVQQAQFYTDKFNTAKDILAMVQRKRNRRDGSKENIDAVQSSNKQIGTKITGSNSSIKMGVSNYKAQVLKSEKKNILTTKSNVNTKARLMASPLQRPRRECRNVAAKAAIAKEARLMVSPPQRLRKGRTKVSKAAITKEASAEVCHIERPTRECSKVAKAAIASQFLERDVSDSDCESSYTEENSYFDDSSTSSVYSNRCSSRTSSTDGNPGLSNSIIASEPQLSSYEKKMQDNVAARLQFLESLGMDKAKQNFMEIL